MTVDIKKQIAISADTFQRLQSLAEPLVDTIDSVIGKLLDAYEVSETRPDHLQNSILRVDPFSPPPLTHTKVEVAELGGEMLFGPTWNGIVVDLIRNVGPSEFDKDRLATIGRFNCVVGRKIDEGYRHYPDLGLSIQGMAADRACRAAFELARHFNVRLSIHFAWRLRPDAAHPGISAIASFDPDAAPSASRRFS